jgi:sporulation protein YlmC with PRC-barrel domain
MGAIEKDRMLQFRGDDLTDRDGEKIGRIEEIYLDADSGEPEWALVHTGLLGTKRSFVPLADATEADGQLRVPLEKDTIKDAPGVEPNGQLSDAEEAELLAHYGREPREDDEPEPTEDEEREPTEDDEPEPSEDAV